MSNLDNELKKYYANAKESIKNGNYEKALEYYLTIIKYEPNNGVILNEIGICYFSLSRHKEAIDYFYKVLKIKPLSDVFNNIGVCFVNSKQYKLAEAHYLKSYNLDNNDKSKSALGNLYYYTKQYEKSIAFYEKVNNKMPVDFYNMSSPYLSKKDFKKGFEFYENRLKSNNVNAQTGLKERVDIPQIPYWNGIDKCNRLLVVYEQGIGDNIQYFRFIIELSKRNPDLKIDYFCKYIIAHIFNSYENIEIVNTVTILNYDYMIYIMSLPKILHLSEIKPNTEEYIKIKDDKLLLLKNKLQDLKKFKVGFVYSGLLSSFIEKYVPLNEFEKLCELDIDLICIQKNQENNSDLISIKQKSNFHLFDIDEEVPFEDTIHILKNIDLLITVDTYIVHLAGVLNIETRLLLGYSEWRWSNEETTYWYNSVKLIRTDNEHKELKDLIHVVKEELQKKLQNEQNE